MNRLSPSRPAEGDETDFDKLQREKDDSFNLDSLDYFIKYLLWHSWNLQLYTEKNTKSYFVIIHITRWQNDT